jgi:hypothetical protein
MLLSFQIKEKNVHSLEQQQKIADLTHNLPAQKYKFYPEGNSLMSLE